MLATVAVCIVVSAVVGVVPAVYIEHITGYIEQGLTSGWNAVAGQIAGAITLMICLYLVGLAATTLYTQLMARVTQGFLHKMRTRMIDQGADVFFGDASAVDSGARQAIDEANKAAGSVKIYDIGQPSDLLGQNECVICSQVTDNSSLVALSMDR